MAGAIRKSLTRWTVAVPPSSARGKALSRERLGAIERKKPDRIYARKLDGSTEAHLIALACSEPPEGRARWTLHLLADTLVTLDEIDVESISHETVRQILKKRTAASPI